MDAHSASFARGPGAPGGGWTFEQIHQAYRPRIQRYLTRLVGPRDAEDVTQLVFVRVSQALAEFRGDAAVGTWLYRIARNAAVDWRRRAARAAALRGDLAAAVPEGGQAAPGPAPDDALIRRDLQQCLHRVLAALPAADRDVLALRDLDGWPTATVAAALALSVANVKVRLHRARGRLRELVVARCDVSVDAEGVTCQPKPSARGCAA